MIITYFIEVQQKAIFIRYTRFQHTFPEKCMIKGFLIDKNRKSVVLRAPYKY